MASFIESPRLSARFVEALQFAAESHRFQVRKTGEVPYIAHLMAVSSLVLEAGGSEDEAIAALLHDYVEDINISGLKTVYDKYGYDVHYMVNALSADGHAQYIEHVKETAIDEKCSVILISCADKLHNLRGYASDGVSLWKPKHRAFYEALLPIYAACHRVPCCWIAEMQALLSSEILEIKEMENKEQEKIYTLAQGGCEEAIAYWQSQQSQGSERPCNCGSGRPWVKCPEQSQYCG